MAIEALSQPVQDLIMVNFEYNLKRLYIGIALLWSIYYVFWARKNQEDTPFLLVAYMRTILYFISFSYLFISPFTFLFLYPQVTPDIVIRLMLTFYIGAFIIFGIIVLINVMFFGPMILFRFGAISPAISSVDKVIEIIFGKKLSSNMIEAVNKLRGKFKHGTIDTS